MITINSLPTHEFQEYANSFPRGYIKRWKASNILYQLTEKNAPYTSLDSVRNLVTDSLIMEGFRVEDCDKIANFLWEKMKND